jgi:hypothetical protein
MSEPTRFQQATADYAVSRLWRDRAPAYRFLVADEVGLGKTIVAREIIRQTLKRFPEGPIDIIYVCSSQAIASQNLDKLVIDAGGASARATRLSLLALNTRSEGDEDRVRYYAITPDTSFNLTRGAGSMRERALIHRLLRSRLRPAGFEDLLRERAGRNSWDGHVTDLADIRPDPRITEAFVGAVLSDDALVAEIRRLAALALDEATPLAFRRARSGVIGRLRALLARAGVDAVAPACLIVVDEFQRYADLLAAPTQGSSLAQELAMGLMRAGDPGRRVLLLSATPYRMPGAAVGGQTYDNFVDLIRFLAGDAPAKALDEALGEFAAALRSPERSSDRITAARDRAAGILKRVMSRTERVSWTQGGASMVEEVISYLDVEPGDLVGAVAARRIARSVKAHDPTEYWKSAPFFLDFMREYQFRRSVMATSRVERRRIAADLKPLLIQQGDLRGLKSTPIPNARMRALIADALPKGVENLLWTPPSLPYLQPAGVFADAPSDLKRLVFSEWRLAPDAISALVSYEVERRLAERWLPKRRRRAGAGRQDPRRAHADFAKPGELLRLHRPGRAGAADSHPAALALLIPGVRLAELGDPLSLATKNGRPVSASSAEAAVRRQIVGALKSLPKGRPEGHPDERWYWAAPLLLDGPEARTWLAEKNPLAWNDGRDQGPDPARAMRLILAHPERLGRRPKDLVKVLAQLALAGPAVCALRALSRTFPVAGLDPAIRSAAFKVARGFQTLFNQNDATVVVQLAYPRIPTYWLQALAYARDGNLQAVLDEHFHLLADAISLDRKGPAERIRKAGEALYGALTLRRATVQVSGLERRRGSGIQSVGLRCRHALRFAEIKDATGGVSRLDAVRGAFNSPFRPFILASTTVGQEGLDFHPWCHAVVHWNLPRTPVELEQREGRVHRYKGQAVRLNVAAAFGLEGLTGRGMNGLIDPWRRLFELAAEAEPDNELAPSWVFEGGDAPRRVKRIVPLMAFSREAEAWPHLTRRLGLYRLVMGLPRHQDLFAAIEDTVTPEEARDWAIDLRPEAKRR